MHNEFLINPKSCYADAERGIAFFDGVQIDADPITDPRWDRVLPVLKEEQIFMCRQMQTLLKQKKGGLVLDVGTGSGVFSIWAAKHGCKVIAIDINPRALRMVAHNARQNQVDVYDNLDQLEAGGICVLHKDFIKEDFKDLITTGKNNDFLGKFDLIILAPPYNPTCKGVFPAQHADAGEDGQLIFNKQIELVPALLKEDGVCVGNHMTTMKNNVRTAFEKIKESFGAPYRIRYAQIIEQGTCSTKLFLQKQYRSYRVKKNNLEPKPPAVRRFIRRVSRQYPELDLVYFEITKQDNSDTSQQPEKIESVYKHSKDWADRIWLHRQIVEHASKPGAKPIPSLFLRDIPSYKLAKLDDSALTTSNEKGNRTLETSLLKIGDDWVRKVGMIEPVYDKDLTSRVNIGADEGLPLFDVLFVDTAPLYKNPQGQQSLFEECYVWLSNICGSSSNSIKIAMLERWQNNTKAQQLASTGPFLHKQFIGANPQDMWSDLSWQVLQGSVRDLLKDDDETKLLNLILDKLDEADKQVERDPVRVNGMHNGYFSTKLGNLAITMEPKEYWNAIYDRLRLWRGEYDLKASDLRTDLEICHLAMQDRMHNAFNTILEKHNLPIFKWSALIGIPLGLTFTEDNNDSLEGYRGGIWVFACSRTPWHRRHETKLLDFVRLLWISYDSVYTSAAFYKKEMISHLRTADSFGHEIKQVARAISSKWFISPDKELKALKPEWNQLNWEIIVLPELLTSVTRILSLWAQTIDPRDVFGGKSPSTLKDLVDGCWNLAKQGLKVSCCRKFYFEIPEDLNNALSIDKAIDALWNTAEERKFNIDVGKDAPNPQWENSELKKTWMELVRVISVVFNDCLKHADLTKPINGWIKVEGENIHFKIENNKKPVNETADSFPDEILPEFREAIRIARHHLESHPLLSGFRGKDIIELYVKEKLGGQIIDSETESQMHNVEFIIPLRNLT